MYQDRPIILDVPGELISPLCTRTRSTGALKHGACLAIHESSSDGVTTSCRTRSTGSSPITYHTDFLLSHTNYRSGTMDDKGSRQPSEAAMDKFNRRSIESAAKNKHDKRSRRREYRAFRLDLLRDFQYDTSRLGYRQMPALQDSQWEKSPRCKYQSPQRMIKTYVKHPGIARRSFIPKNTATPKSHFRSHVRAA